MAGALTVLHLDTERGWRGGERQALWLAEGLAALGHRSLVAARPEEPLAERAAAAGLSVVPCRPWGSGELDLAAAVALRGVVGRYAVDVVHAHTGHTVTLGALATAGTGVPLVVTRRVDFPLRRNLGSRWKYGRAAAVIAVSDAVGRVLIAGGMAAERITVIPSGIDLRRRVAPASGETLRSLGVPGGAPLVVQVAQLVGHKDPVTFVRAVAAARVVVPSVQALLVGDGPLAGAVDAAVRELGLEGVVHAVGYRTDADALIAAADVVTLSSREEGLGTVLLDAMAFGGAIAATAAGGIPEMVEDGRTGLLAPVGDGAALGERIGRLLTDRELAARLRAGARERVTAFSVERTVERTVAVYERVLGGI